MKLAMDPISLLVEQKEHRKTTKQAIADKELNSSLFVEPDKMQAWNFHAGSDTKTLCVKGRIVACNCVHTMTWDAANSASFKRDWIKTIFPGHEEFKEKHNVPLSTATRCN